MLMLHNYLTLAFRNLLKNRLYTALNVSGLGIGVAACLLILLFVAHESRYDRWNPLADRIVRPTYDIKIKDFNERHASVDAIVGPEAAAALPEIQAWCRIRPSGTWRTRREGQAEQNSREEKVLSVDSTFFEIFPLKVLAGAPMRCLNQPNVVAISSSCAARYFSSPEMALGQTLLMGRTGQRQQVSAVFEDFPENAHFHTDILLPLTGNEDLKNAPAYWGYNNTYFTYFLLRKAGDKANFARKFQALANEKVGVLLKDLFGTTLTDFEKAGQRAHFGLQNLPDIHLHSDMQSELEANGNIRYVWIFSAIALFILLIACINFMNLSTARSSGRAREVGVRKVLGSSRTALAGQFLTESVLLSALSVLLALGLAQLALPLFCELSGRNLSIPWSNPVFWAATGGGILLVGLVAGAYPAFFLSAFNAIRVLKGKMLSPQQGGAGKGFSFRNGLVVFQFAISTTLIISTLLVYSQLQFIQRKQLGFDKSQVLIVNNAHILGERAEAFKTEMLKNARIENATTTNYLPMPDSYRENCMLSTQRATGPSDKVLQRWQVDAHYISALGMEIKQGRNFDASRVTDSAAIIINETAARELGFADPVGKTLFTSKTKAVDSKPEDFEALTIIGVVNDFHYESLHNPVGGLFLQLGQTNGAISFRIKGADAAPVIAALEQQWNSFGPDRPISYQFMDETLNRMYGAEQRIGKIALLFALLSALVACLGLFGLASYMTEQRTKEIGVRKVLGASVASVTRLLAGDFLKLVALSILLATPVAWFFMNKWLADFAYRIEMEWWMFAAAGLVAIAIALFTVGFQSLKTALTNPVDSLRSE